MYQTYMRVPVGQLREQIETNKILMNMLLLEPHTSWNTLMCHTPEAEKKDIYTCRKGYCRYKL